MNLDNILIKGCPLCDIFLHPEKNFITKLYYPEDKEQINKVDFIIIESKDSNIPIVIIRDHVAELTRELWGRILYQCRQLFGTAIRLRYKPRLVKDHYHCYVYIIK